MSAPRVVIDLDRIEHNARALVRSLAPQGISVIGVTKAVCGLPAVADAMGRGGVEGFADSRITNLGRLDRAGVAGTRMLLRSPMLSELDDVVRDAHSSAQTEIEVIRRCSDAAGRVGRSHGVVLMVELGDLREGIMPEDLDAVVTVTAQCPHVVLEGIGTNLACQSGVVPDESNMSELSALAAAVEATTGVPLARVSGGNSASIAWALGGADTGRVDELRLGEAILLGREPLARTPIDGLCTDAVALVAEVIESKCKPSRPWGEIGQNVSGAVGRAPDRGMLRRTIVAIGLQDVDPDGVTPSGGRTVLGASSDHLVLTSAESGEQTGDQPGDEIRFDLGYGALLRAMTSPYVGLELVGGRRVQEL
jgi:predicted amino acid racemase